jgi:hypothetical protein
VTEKESENEAEAGAFNLKALEAAPSTARGPFQFQDIFSPTSSQGLYFTRVPLLCAFFKSQRDFRRFAIRKRSQIGGDYQLAAWDSVPGVAKRNIRNNIRSDMDLP